MTRQPLTHPVAFPKASLRPMSGVTELAVAEAATGPGTRPERVTALLAAVYERIADEASTPALARRLSSGAREWLLQGAALQFHPDLDWFETSCRACGEPYDLSLSIVAAARRPARDVFPEVEVETSLGRRCFEAPNGGHEEALARHDNAADPRRTFAGLCGLGENAVAEAAQFTESDLEAIDDALEDISPDVADSALSVCPSCGAETTARFDPMVVAFPKVSDVLRDAHLLASAYGWSESRILRLPARRRADYAALIAQERRARGARIPAGRL